MIFRSLFYLIIILLFPVNSLKSQEIQFYSSSNIISMLDKLDVFGKVLYVAAHPDDENTRLIAYLSNEMKYETAYLSATRGGGGQNFIGTHLKENLGLIRTHELLEARKIDGGKQFFSSAIDFGYSKGPDETLDFWNEEKILSDFVWIIRKFRPDIIITRFNQTPGTTHGHHTSSAILANKAFNLSGDPGAFPEQLKHLKVWKAKRIFWNTSSRYFNIDNYDKDELLKIDVGIYNNLIGKSYNEIASESRSMHKSQAFGSLKRRGSEIELLIHTQGEGVKSDLMEGIDTSWDRVLPNELLRKHIQNARDSFNIREPYKIIIHLSLAHKELNRIIDRHWREIKKNEIKNLIKACSGLFFESLSDVELVARGEKININFDVINRSPSEITLEKITILDQDIIIDKNLENNKLLRTTKKITLPNSDLISEKYWLIDEPNFGNYNINNQLLVGKPDNDPSLISEFVFRINGQRITYEAPVIYKANNPTKGDDYRSFNVGNPIYMNPKNKMELFVNSNKKNIEIEVESGIDKLNAQIYLDMPDNLKSEPEIHEINLSKKGDKETLIFTINLPNEKKLHKKITYNAKVNELIYDRGIDKIIYEHITPQTRFPKSEIALIKFDLNIKANKIAYLMGSGDKVPGSLSLVGYEVDILGKEDINYNNLSEYDALIIGIRAFNVDKSLPEIKPELMKFMNGGGNVIIQYNTSRGINVDDFAPYPFKLSRNRVSQENSSVEILDGDHPALNYPNKIKLSDFDNWVQERGLYFPNQWSDRYKTVISSNDDGEDPNNGGILIAEVGKGHFIYTSYSWFRQLPAGVGGAYKLFSNLISLGKK